MADVDIGDIDIVHVDIADVDTSDVDTADVDIASHAPLHMTVGKWKTNLDVLSSLQQTIV